MKKLFSDFKKFITRGNVIDMAVGVAVATAFTAIVTAFTKGFITPLLTLLTGESDLDEMKWVVRDAILDSTGAEVEGEVAIMWGPFVHAIMDFFIIALSLFIVIKVAASLRERAEKIHKKARDFLTDSDEKAAAAAAEAAAKAEEERIAKEKEQAEADRLARQEQLLTEIRDLLKQK